MQPQTTPTRRSCAGPGCRTRIGRRWLMCPRCWNLVPDHLRRLITRNYRPGRRQTLLYHAAVRQAIDAIAATRRRAS